MLLESFIPSSILNYTFAGNNVNDYIFVVLSFIGVLIIFKIVQSVIVGHLQRISKRTKTDIDDTVVDIIRSVKPPFYFILSLYLSINILTLSNMLRKFLFALLIAVIIYQVVITVQILITFVFTKAQKRNKTDAGTRAAVQTLSKVLKGVLWAIGVLLILSNLGVNVTSLIAGLGIGGVAIALAAQNILGDLFNHFAILFDKPFVPGDIIQVGSQIGEVEKIGIKTTRLRSLQGEEIIISNSELTSSQIQNFKRMDERRAKFSFGVVYEIKSDTLEKIPEIVKRIIDKIPGARFERAHFHEFADSSLNFEIIYYVNSREFGFYRDVHQKILFLLKREFEKLKIGMAYPTQKIYIQK